MIRFGIITESLIFRKWEVECIKKALNINNVSLKMLILPSRNRKLHKSNFLSKILTAKRFSTLFFNIYKKLFINPDCFSRIDLSGEFRNIEKIYFNYEKNVSIKNFLNKDFAKIRNKNLDFIISFLEINNIDFKFSMITKYGIWKYHHDDEEKYRGSLHCFWEIYYRDDVNGVILKKLTPDKNKFIVLREGYFRTINYSYKKNKENVYLQTVDWLKQVCIDLLNDELVFNNNLPRVSKAKYYGEPTNLKFIKFYLILLKNRFIGFFRKYFLIELWNIGYINKPINQFLDDKRDFKVNWLFPGDKKISRADPFPIKWRNKIYILFESYEIKKSKGEIHSFIFNPFKILKREVSVVMSKHYHLSYPFVFNYKNEIYLLPESIQNSEVALYKASEFPIIWEKKAVLIKNFSCSDPTIFFYDNYWWLACSGGNADRNNKLYIFYSKELFGSWLPHKKNPVKIDIRSSRPAGKVFKYNGSLIRPSQDCSKSYGRRIILNKIIELTPFKFKEKAIKIINPVHNCSFRKGIHTFNPIGNIIAVDGKRDIFIINKFLIKRKFKYTLHT